MYIKSVRYRGGWSFHQGGSWGPLWSMTMAQAAVAAISYFDGLTTSIRLTGAGKG